MREPKEMSGFMLNDARQIYVNQIKARRECAILRVQFHIGIVDFARCGIELSRCEGNGTLCFNAIGPISIVEYPDIVVGASCLVSCGARNVGAIDIGKHVDDKIGYGAIPTIDGCPLLKRIAYDVSHLIGSDVP
jgi:hypothetical protein